MNRTLDVVVAGCGTAGAVTATLLAAQGHRVTVLERAEEPSAIGAGIMLQHLGLQVLDRIGVLDELQDRSRPVRRVDARTLGGRTLMDFGYADVPGAQPALGVHRGVLFTLLMQALRDSPATLRTGVQVVAVEPAGDRLDIVVEGSSGPVRWGSADLVVGADGVRSTVRSGSGLTVRDHAYAYGALWAVVDDPEQIAADVLYQCVDGTRSYLGVLPTGAAQSSIFWSIRTDKMAETVARGVPAWRSAAQPFGGRYEPLLDQVDHLLEARYRDVVVRRPYRTSGPAGVALVGDSAHAMSPQLGTGASLALADSWTLAHAVQTAPDLPAALSAYASSRRAHVRWYSWWTRLMMPAFQSELVPLGWARDLLAHPFAHLPGVRAQLVSTLMGHRTSPWSQWQLPEPSVSSVGPAAPTA